jgi:hypothetical protein
MARIGSAPSWGISRSQSLATFRITKIFPGSQKERDFSKRYVLAGENQLIRQISGYLSIFNENPNCQFIYMISIFLKE